MSRQNIYASADEDDARRVVSRVVAWFRASGHKNEHAIEQAAIALGITPRRAWALRYPSQLVKVARGQRALLLHRYWTLMDRQAAELRDRAEIIERQAEAERLAAAQLVLPLVGGDQCSGHSVRGSHSASGDAHSIGATRRK